MLSILYDMTKFLYYLKYKSRRFRFFISSHCHFALEGLLTFMGPMFFQSSYNSIMILAMSNNEVLAGRSAKRDETIASNSLSSLSIISIL